MGLREFTSVPADPRQWGKWMRAQFITADSVAPNTITTGMIVDANVTFAKIQNLNALSVLGRSVNSAGVGGNISAANDAEVLRRSGTTLGFGKVATGGIANDAVSNTLLADMAQDTIKGRTSGAGTGDPVDLTAAQVATIISTAVASALNIGNVTSYTPTLTNVTNLDSSTANLSWYIRVRDMVFVFGFATVDPTALASTELGISVPIASNFGGSTDGIGVAHSQSVAGQGAGLIADGTNDRMRMIWTAGNTGADNMFYVFMYRVI